MAADPILVNIVDRTLRERIFGTEFQSLDYFADQSILLNDLFSQLEQTIIRNLDAENVTGSPEMINQVVSGIDALLDQAVENSLQNDRSISSHEFATNLLRGFCPRFPIC